MVKNKKKLLFSILLILIVIITINTSYAGNFNDLQNNISTATGGTLDLEDNYTDDSGVQINITNNIVIDGKGHTINFNKKTNHMRITTGVTVTLKNIILINANSDSNGGAIIANNATLLLNNATFENDTTTFDGGGGGAIYAFRSTVTINNSIFNNNTARINGGAIFALESTFTITNSTFNNNRAGAHGGAIYNTQSNSTIINSTFNNNNAGDSGGAITNTREAESQSLAFLNITGSTFTNNNLTSTSGQITGTGGAIKNKDLLKITNSTFKQNAAMNGGAIATGYMEDYNLNVTSSTFINNTKGSAIYNYLEEGGYLNISQSIIIDTNPFTIDTEEYASTVNVNIEDNYWTNKPTIAGITPDNYYVFKINASNTNPRINDIVNLNIIYVSNGTDNEPWTGPTMDIGTITFTTTPEATIEQTGNTATFKALTPGTYTINASSTLTSIPALSTEITVRVPSFYDLQQEITSNLTAGTNMTLTQDYFDNNGTQITINGSITINGNGHTLNFNQQTDNNIIINNGATVTLNNLTLTNSENTNGGAIYNNGNLTITNTTFNHNNATNRGGAIHNNGNLTITNSTFINNTASYDGGAIYNERIFNITNSIFNQNNADDDGGAIYNYGGNLTITNTTFNHNNANMGGAIGNVESGTLTITNSTFTNNTVIGNGKAIYNMGDCNISQSVLIGEDDMIYSDGVCVADGNYWGNKNPTTDNLVNFVVGDYYRFSLGDDISTSVGSEITLSVLVRLNTTEEATWDGPTLSMPNPVFSSNPTTAVLIPTGNTVKFNASAVGVYDLRATMADGTSTIAIAVIDNSSLTIDTLNLTTIKGTLTDTTINKPISNADLTISINGKTITDSVTTDANGVYSYDHGLSNCGPYVFSVTFTNTNYNTSTASDTLLVPLVENITVGPVSSIYGMDVSFNGVFVTNNVSTGDKIIFVKIDDDDVVANGTVDARGGVSFNISRVYGVGNYTLSFIHNGELLNTTNWNVKHANSSLTTEFNSTTINGTLTDTTNNKPISGVNVTIRINSTNYKVTTELDGKYTFEHNITHFGNYRYDVMFVSMDNYVNSSVNDTLEVPLLENITVGSVNSTYGTDATFTGVFTSNDLITGANITVKINNTEVLNTTVGTLGAVLFTIPGTYNIGTHTLKFYNNGNELNTTFWTVSPANTSLSTSFNSTTINGTLMDTTNNKPINNANITITINGSIYNVRTDENGTYNYKYTLTYGIYQYVVIYNTNTNYNTSTASARLEIPLKENITIGDVTSNYGTDATFTGVFTSNNLTTGANITVKINNNEVLNTTVGTSGAVSFTIPGTYNNGTYTLKFYNNGKELNTTTWTVNKASSSLTVNVNLTTINGTLTDTTNNKPINNTNVTININNTNVNVTTDSNGVYTYNHNIDTSVYGNYPVTVTFNNINYDTSTATGALNISLVENITTGPVTSIYGENATFSGTFTTNNVTSGANITVKINTTEITSNLTDDTGKVSFTIPGKAAGTYTLSFYHNGELLNTTQWTVNPANSSLTIDANRTLVNGTLLDGNGKPIPDAIVNITINGGVGTTISTTNTTNSKGEFSYALTVDEYGDYNVTVSFSNPNYNSSNATTSFNIALVENITVDPVTSVYNNGSVTFNGTFTSNNITTGEKIILKINNTGSIEGIVIEGGNVTFTITDLYNVGTYTLSFTHNDLELNTTTWTISQASSSLTVNATKDLVNGTLLDGNGAAISGATITIRVNDETAVTNTTNSEGKFSYVLTKTKAGDYTVTVSFAGGNYTSSDATASFNIPLVENITTGQVTSIYDKNVTFDGTFTSNNVTAGAEIIVKIGDTPVANNVTGADGNVSFTISNNYTVGNHTLEFYHNGELLNTTQWTVNPANSSLTIDANRTRVNGTLLDGNGKPIAGVSVNITINGGVGTTISITNTTNSKGEFTYALTVNEYGDYNVTVSFSNPNYNSSNATATFNIALVENITTSPVISIYGDNITVNGTFTTNNVTSGVNITVKINTTEITSNLTDATGKVSFIIPGKDVGIYTLSFYHNGNLLNTTTWTVNKANSSLTASRTGDLINGTLFDGNGKPIASVNVNMSLDSRLSSATTTNSTGGFTFTVVSKPGDHVVFVSFSNPNYNSSNTTIRFNVPLVENITTESVTSIYDADVSFNGTFTSNNITTGANITVKINTAEIANGTVNTDGKVSFTISSAYDVGTYTLSFYNNGRLLNTTTWTVNRANSSLTLTVNSTTVTGILTDTSNNKRISGVNITIKLNGTHTVTTDNNGVYTYNHNIIHCGSYQVTVESSTINYGNRTNSSLLNINLAENITVNPVTSTYGSNVTFSGVFTSNNATTGENITVNIGNDNVATGTVNTDGSVSFTITQHYGAGTFKLEFYHHDKLLNSTTWTIKKPTTITITTMTSSLKQGNTFKIVVTLKTGTTPLVGKIVTFKGYRGKTYTNKTNSKGQATLYIKKVVAGTYTITAQYQGDTTQYNLSNKVSRKLTVAKPVTILKITSTTPRNGQKGYSQTRTFIITFNQKIKKSSKYSKIYIRNLNTRLYVTFTKKIVGNKLYIKMKAKRYKRHYYRIYIPRYAVVSYNKKTISKARTIKFRT